MKIFKFITISISLIFAFLISAIILGIVLKSSPRGLLESFLSREIRFAIFLSLWTSFLSTVLCLAVAIPSAYSIARHKFFGRGLVRIIIDLPIALPPIVVGMGLFLFALTSPFGFTLPAIVLAQFFVNAPYATRILASTFSDIDPRYELVAQTLGKSHFQSFFKVTLPMAKSGIVGSTAITWARGIGEFGAVLLFAGAIAMRTETLPIALYLNMSCGNMEGAIACATLLIIISLIALCIFERFGRGRF